MIAAGKLEKIVLGVCRGLSLYGKLLPNHFTAYLIKVIDCIWDKFFDLENVEKGILNFVSFYILR